MNHEVQELSLQEIEMVAGSVDEGENSSSPATFAEGVDVPQIENNPPG